MLRRLLTLAITFTAMVQAASVALAGPQTYAARAQTIRAGVLIIDSATGGGAYPQSSGPYALYNFDANRTVKPVGWNVVNPHAPSRVTAATVARWKSLDSTATLVGGERIAKRQAAYWEVFLSSVSDTALNDYDLLLLNPFAYAQLTPFEREKLRRFVDHGGLLWIDPAGLTNTANAGIDLGNNFPAPFGLGANGALVPELSDFSHPLLSRPFALSGRDIDLINNNIDGNPIGYEIQPTGLSGSSIAAFYQPEVADYLKIRSVAQVAGASTIGVTQIGAGFVVITSRGASIKLNRTVGAPLSGTGANFAYSGQSPVIGIDGEASAKLLVNMVNLLSQYRQQSADSQKSGGSAIDLGGPLMQRVSAQVSFPAKDTNGKTNIYGAVLYRGMVIVADQGHLVAFNANPNSTLAGTSDPSTGTPVYNVSGVDELWESPDLGGPISVPVIAEVPDAQGLPTDQVLITGPDGTVHAYNPVAKLANGLIDRTPRVELWSTKGVAGIPPPSSSSNTGIPNPPTVHEGLAYIADREVSQGSERGRVWVINLRTGTRMTTAKDWVIGTDTGIATEPFTASPTVGYIPVLDNSGGMDKVLYAPMALNTTNNTAAGFISIWIGARGENPTQVTVTDPVKGILEVTTRAAQQGGLPIYAPTGASAIGDPLAVKITVLDPVTGNPYDNSKMFTGSPTHVGGGVLNFTMTGFANGLFTSKTPPAVRVDYTIDWGDANPGSLSAGERGRLQLPDQQSSPTRDVIGPVVLTPGGTIYVAASPVTASATTSAGVFGFKEQGRGNFICNLRYELYPKYTFSTQGAGEDNQAAVVDDNDGVNQMAPTFLAGKPLTSFTITGAPSVRNGQVFVAANAKKSTGVPVTVLLAFQAEPSAPQFNIDNLPDGSVLVQADLVRSSSFLPADVPSVIPTSSYVYDTDTKLLRIDNLMNVPKGQIQQCLSLSQRLYVRRPGLPDLPLDPDGQGGDARWSPLLWYTVLNGFSTTAGPMVTGNSVYLGGTSKVLSILSGQNPITATANGLLYAIQGQIAPNDPFLVSSPTRSWNKQLMQVTTVSDAFGNVISVTGNPDVEWPQYTGTGGMSTFLSRLKQTVLTNSTTVQGMAGGDGILIAQGDSGLYTFDRADFVVADQGRLITFDPSGNPIWSTTSYVDSGGDIGGAGAIHSFVRPTRAYRLNPTEFLVVDSASNDIVRVNQAGVATRVINRFQLDSTKVPDGYAPNETLKLTDPRDAITFTSLESVSGSSSVTASDNHDPYEYWVHTLIADAGNRRLVELIDRYQYDATRQERGPIETVGGKPQSAVLLWHSPTSVSGKNFAYCSISRAVVPLPTNTAGNPVGTRYVYIAGVGSVMPTPSSVGTTPSTTPESAGGNGAVIVFDPVQPGPIVLNQLTLPVVGANLLWQENPATGVGDFTTPIGSSGSALLTTKTMSNISALSTFVVDTGGNPIVKIMISEATGVYEADYAPTSGSSSGNALNVTWMLPNRAFRVMRGVSGTLPNNKTVNSANPRELRAVYAVRLSANDVVIVNGYFGQYRDGSPFSGEVVQVASGDFSPTSVNLGFNSNSITFKLPSIQGTRGLVSPAFADRR